MKLHMRLYSHTKEGGISRRFHKFRYTSALRLGVTPKVIHDVVEFDFEGNITDDVVAHKNNIALIGALTIDRTSFENIVLITNPIANGRYGFITFWPISQHADAHESYTDPLVDTAVDGTPFDIDIVATKMHTQFKINAGVSPATLMKMIYEDESEKLRASAEKLGNLIDEALLISKLEAERADKEKLRADEEAMRAENFENEAKLQRENVDAEILKNEKLQMENDKLRRAAYIEPPKNEAQVISSQVKLEKAYEGAQGKYNQRAVILLLSDGTTRSNNWKYGFEERLAYAKSLEEQYITTDVWGGYDGNKWYKNIYPANIENGVKNG